MQKRGLLTLPVLLVAVLALALGSVGTAAAGGLTKSSVKKIAAKVVSKKASGLSVAHASTADTATTATTATNATNAATATNAAHASLADGLSVLPSGQTESGSFAMATGGPNSYMSTAINYPRPLSSAIANNHIIDTSANPDATHCPGAGQAAAGYLCLYFEFYTGIDTSSDVYGYSDNSPYTTLGKSVGVALYAYSTGATNYASGVWTVGAP